jgi:hypothetical protein
MRWENTMAKHIRPSHFPTSFFDQQSLTFLRILHSYSSSFKVIHAHNAGPNIDSRLLKKRNLEVLDGILGPKKRSMVPFEKGRCLKIASLKYSNGNIRACR